MPRPGAAAAGAAGRPRRGTRSSGECPALAAVQGPRGGGRGPWGWEGRSAKVSAGDRGVSVEAFAGRREASAWCQLVRGAGGQGGRGGAGTGRAGPARGKTDGGIPGRGVPRQALRSSDGTHVRRGRGLCCYGAGRGLGRKGRRARGGRWKAGGRGREAGRDRGCRRGAISELRRVCGAQAWLLPTQGLRVWNAGC